MHVLQKPNEKQSYEECTVETKTLTIKGGGLYSEKPGKRLENLEERLIIFPSPRKCSEKTAKACEGGKEGSCAGWKGAETELGYRSSGWGAGV